MKRLLFSLWMSMVLVVSADAGEVTFDFVNESYGLTRYSTDSAPYISSGTICRQGGVEIYFSKMVGKSGFRLWTDGLRFYRNSTARIYVSAPGGSLLSVTIKGDDGAEFEPDAVSAGDGTMLSNVWTAIRDDVEEVCLDYTGTGTYAVHTIEVGYLLSGEAAIVEIAADEADEMDAPAEYFTLQGRRVEARSLLPGIYLCRKGSKVEKIRIF